MYLLCLLAVAAVSVNGLMRHVPEELLSNPSPYYNPVYWQKAAVMVANMTLSEKLGFMHGVGGTFGQHYAGQTAGLARMGIPQLTMEDGPQGVGDGTTGSTAFPSGLTTAASFDVAMSEAFGRALGAEQRTKGTMISLGPELNIIRVPLGGRNYESTAGEDPVLAAGMVGGYIRGMQSQGVMACAKHFDDNNQEFNRTTMSEVVPEQAQWDLYFKGFLSAIKAGSLSVMCSYNKINGTYACENSVLKNLRQFGFKGLIVSDWGATHSTVASLKAGLDIEMPSGIFYTEKAIQAALSNGDIDQSEIDDRVVNTLGAMISLNLVNNPPSGKLSDDARTPEHLQNNLKYVLGVFGDDAGIKPISEGGGSGFVANEKTISPFAALKSLFTEKEIPQQIVYGATADPQNQQNCNDSVICLICVSSWSHEGVDRTTLNLSQDQLNLINDLTKVKKEIIVVVHSTGSVVVNSFVDDISALLFAFMPGEQDGPALSDVLLGETDAGGRWDFEFGFGLSYGNFVYSKDANVFIENNKLRIDLEITNNGQHFGSEVSQVYVTFPGKKIRNLNQFQKNTVASSDTLPISFEISTVDLLAFSSTQQGYVVEDGKYGLFVGSSSEIIHISKSFCVKNKQFVTC